jgi:polysaccharide deacetylase family protein (PEP-CTERM system associated)
MRSDRQPSTARTSSGRSGITVTIDVEEFEHDESRAHTEDALDRVLDFLDERDVRATAFVVGTFAARRPELVRRIARGGHEIGLHGHRHQMLDSFDPTVFEAETRDARLHLADVAGAEVDGYRAPSFSLTPSTLWAPRALLDAGFRYSSSVVPTRHPRAHVGFPGAPRGPFVWSCGLVELPCPLFAGIPVGGAYLRLAPARLCSRMVRSSARRTPWIYVHPRDFDVDEPFAKMPDHSRLESYVLFARRGVMFSRLDRALRLGSAPPLRERLDELLAERLPVVPST